MTDQLRRTLTLLETLLDYLPGPQMIRSAAADDSPSEARSRVYTTAELSRQIAHLEHQQRLRAGDYKRASEAWEHARREQYREGDYAALDAALDDLRVLNARWHDLAWRVATHHPGVLDQALRVELVETIRWLAVRMPMPARVPSWTRPSALPAPATLVLLRQLGIPSRVLLRVYGPGVVGKRRKVPA